MNKTIMLKINNSKKAAIPIKKKKITGQWKDPGAGLYNTLLGAQHIVGNKKPPDGSEELNKMIKEGKYLLWDSFIKEAYLVAPVKDIKNSPYGITPFAKSGCKYPHHVIKNGELVVSIPGLRAAYICARNQGCFDPDVSKRPSYWKELTSHFNRHCKELGLKPMWRYGEFYLEESYEVDIEQNFMDIYEYIDDTLGTNLIENLTYLDENWDPSNRVEMNYRSKDDRNADKRARREDRRNAYDVARKIRNSEGISKRPQNDLESINELRESAMSNEAIVFSKDVLEEIGNTPEQLYEWMSKNISYDTSNDWNLKTPSEVFVQKNGNSHDQALFEAFQLHSWGYVANGQIFFVESNEDMTSTGNSHTLTWYRVDKENSDYKHSFYWIENAWEGCNGIHGPYNDLTGLRHAVMEKFKKDKIINSYKFDGISFSYDSNYRCGMNEEEYINSWIKPEYIPFDIEKSIEESMNWIDQFVNDDDFRESVEVFTEKSHSSLDYCYRIGFDVKTGEQVAVQFLLDPEKITSIGSKDLMKSAYNGVGRRIPNESNMDDSRVNVTELAKKQIRKNGHIDFVTGDLIVDNIFYRGGKSIDSVEMIGLFSDPVINIINLERNFNDDTIDQIISSDSFKNNIKKLKVNFEKYTVGRKGGKNKYKTTKLMWSRDLFISFKTTPVLRGYNKPPKNDIVTMRRNGAQYNFMNQCKESSDFQVLNDIFKVKNDFITFGSEDEIYQQLQTDEYCEKYDIDAASMEYIAPSHTIQLDDAAYEWRCNTGIELITDIVPYDEAVSMWENWKLMDADMKYISDMKSMELYGMNNAAHFDKIVYENSYELNESTAMDFNKLYFASTVAVPGSTISVKSPRVLMLYQTIDASILNGIDRNSVVKDYFDSILAKNGKEIYVSKFATNSKIIEEKDGVVKIQINHDVPSYTEVKDGTDILHIYEVDVSKVKYELTMNEDGWCYRGSDKLPIKKVDDKEVKLSISYSKDIGTNGNIEIKDIKESVENITIHKLSNSVFDDAHFRKWFVKNDDFKDIQPNKFNYDVFKHPNKIKYGLFINDNIEFVLIFIRHDKFNDIEIFYGNPEKHNNGYGQQLLKFVLQKYPETEFRITPYRNNLRAVHLYKKLGFEEIDPWDFTGDDNVDEQYKSSMIPMSRTPKPFTESDENMSEPKKTDAAEANKNGVRRKKLYIAFIEWCKEFNPKNVFGSIFDKDAFTVTYPFVPNEMRYFYRLANPVLCVLSGQLTFFQVSELKNINTKNQKMNEMMIFAATPNDLRIFNNADKKVYLGIDNNGEIKLDRVLASTFDQYIQNMIGKGDILNGPIEEEKSEIQENQ